MLAAILIGIFGGQRSLTPLAAVSVAAARGALPDDRAVPRVLRHPAVAAGAVALALGELAGDKMKSAPDRIVPAGLAARLLATGIAGGALAPRGEFWKGAAVSGLTAVLASYPGWRLRRAEMERHGQTPTGLLEDAAVIAGTVAVLRGLHREGGGRGAPVRRGSGPASPRR